MQNTDTCFGALSNLEGLERTLTEIARNFGVAINLIDYAGFPVIEPCNFGDYCKYMRSDERRADLCRKADAHAGLEAVRRKEPCLCCGFCGLAFVAVPVSLGGRYPGALICGQIRAAAEGKERLPEKLLCDALPEEMSSYARQKLGRLYEKLPEIKPYQLMAIARLAGDIVQSFTGCGAVDRGSVQPGENAPPPIRVPKESRIYPAVEYIEKNFDKNPTAAEMAALCQVSRSNFSKLFEKEMREGYVAYLRRKKMEAAKRMLTETSDSVTKIAEALGYSEMGYFVKVFKASEGITPLAYRQLQKYNK